MLEEDGVVSTTPRPLYTQLRDPGAQCTGGWMGSGASMDGCGKSRLRPEFDPQTSVRRESLYRLSCSSRRSW
jgi:hypothetical protein